MKSDRRHELQTNELADWLGERLEALRPHAMPITIVAIAVVALGLGSIWYFGNEDHGSAEAWKTYFGAFSQREPEKTLEELAKQRNSAGLWAKQALGDMNLAQGAALLFSDRAESTKRLQKAEEAYKEVEAAASEPMLKSRARLGLGKVYEALFKLKDAEKYYSLVAETEKDSALGKLAAADAKRMKNSRDQDLLAWFAQQQPRRPTPLPGTGGGTPGFPTDLPERPDISPPSGLGLDKDKLGTGVPAEPAPTFPAPATTPPEGAKSEANKPDDGKQPEAKPDVAKPESAKSEGAPPAAAPEPAKPAAPEADKKQPE